MCISKQVPFDIPDSWEWIRLGELTYNHGQKKPDTVFSYIDIGSIDNLNQKLNSVENHLELDNAPSRARKIVEKWDIIYSTVRPYLHNMCIIDKDFMHPPIASTGFAVMACLADYCRFFLFYYLLSPCFDNYANNRENSKGVAYPAINDERLYRALIPVPPMEEQQRIVAKIEQILPYIKEYELSESRIGQLNAAFPEQLKKSILQEAVQGKLVPQDPSDESASALLERIREEKWRLVKEGKIKKDKNESVIFRRDNSYYEKIGDNEPVCIQKKLPPFEIPDSWEWVRLNNIFSVINGNRGKNYPAKSTLSNNGIPFISAVNLDGKSVVNDDNLLCLSEAQYDKLGSGKLIKDDVVVCIRGSLGKHGKFPFDKGAIASSLVILRSIYNEQILSEFIMMFLDSPLFFDEIKKFDKGTAQPNLAAKSLEQFFVPIPPLAEQKRIICQIEQLLTMAKCL